MTVLIVAGPPCSGKTTYARAHATARDVVLDWDVVFAEVTGLPLWDQPRLKHAVVVADDALAAVVEQEFQRRAARMTSGFILRWAALKQRRAMLRKIYRARSLVLAVPAAECLRRLELTDRPAEVKARNRYDIARWWSLYQPSSSPSESTLRPRVSGGVA